MFDMVRMPHRVAPFPPSPNLDDGVPHQRAADPTYPKDVRLRPAVGASHAQRPANPPGEPTLRDIEISHIKDALEKHIGNRPAASKEPGICLKTLYNKINQLQQT